MVRFFVAIPRVSLYKVDTPAVIRLGDWATPRWAVAGFFMRTACRADVFCVAYSSQEMHTSS